jgi:hypothetical protein
MVEYYQRMEHYEVDSEENVIEPELNGSKKPVLATHDESTFYGYDGKKTRWVQEGKSTILPKGPGQSLMVSDFMCPCHGTMKVPLMVKKLHLELCLNQEKPAKDTGLVKIWLTS